MEIFSEGSVHQICISAFTLFVKELFFFVIVLKQSYRKVTETPGISAPGRLLTFVKTDHI